jgi:hypothetical protein
MKLARYSGVVGQTRVLQRAARERRPIGDDEPASNKWLPQCSSASLCVCLSVGGVERARAPSLKSARPAELSVCRRRRRRRAAEAIPALVSTCTLCSPAHHHHACDSLMARNSAPARRRANSFLLDGNNNNNEPGGADGGHKHLGRDSPSLARRRRLFEIDVTRAQATICRSSPHRLPTRAAASSLSAHKPRKGQATIRRPGPGRRRRRRATSRR